MSVHPSILCPIDYSEASAAALRYAAAVAEHFVARLIVLTVEDPMLTAALDLGTGSHWTREASESEIAAFVAQTFGDDPVMLALCDYEVGVGRPAVEILRVARDRACDLIVMSSHGLSGARKMFFGSTTERVLRETPIPVLVTPPVNPGRVRIEEARRLVRRIVVPVDLSPASLHQTQVAMGLGDALQVPVVLVHVIEPIKTRLLRAKVPGLDAERRSVAEEALDELVALRTTNRPEALIVFGDPAEEASKVVHNRQAGLVVMGLHGSPLLGPRMGSVTYRLLCLSETLVLALPPKIAKPAHRDATVPVEVQQD
jgi:nucleotide-binding universal stress UspA family protein